MIFNFQANQITTLYIYETATIVAGDTITAHNNKRESSNTSMLTLVKDPTISVQGTCIDSMKIGTEGVAIERGGGAGGRERELILNPDIEYLYIFVSGEASNIITYYYSWYEEATVKRY